MKDARDMTIQGPPLRMKRGSASRSLSSRKTSNGSTSWRAAARSRSCVAEVLDVQVSDRQDLLRRDGSGLALSPRHQRAHRVWGGGHEGTPAVSLRGAFPPLAPGDGALRTPLRHPV